MAKLPPRVRFLSRRDVKSGKYCPSVGESNLFAFLRASPYFSQQSQQSIKNRQRMRGAAGDEEVDGYHASGTVVYFAVVDVGAAR